MTTYNTSNPIGSTDPKDLYDNAQNLDNIVNGSEHSYADRLGVARRSLAGIDAAADAVLSGLGYAPPVPYAAGISLTLTTQTVEYSGEVYAPKLSALPLTTGATFDPTKFRLIQGVVAADLAAPGGSALVGFQQAGVGAVPSTVNAELKRQIFAQQFGVVGGGSVDDTAAFAKAMAYCKQYGGELLVPWVAGGYLISDLKIPAGVRVRGTGGDTSPFGSYWYQVGGNGSQYDLVNTGATIFRVASGGKGVTVESDTGTGTSSGGYLENIAIEGPETGGAEFGLKILGMSASTKDVTVNRFPDGVGVEMGFHFRSQHDRLRIRNCGIGLFFNGVVGAVNGVPFHGLLIEECVVGIYHIGADGGLPSTANTFVSPVIEAISRRAGLAWPAHVTLNSTFKSDTGMDETTVCGAVVMGTDASFTFVSPYMEAINGPHLYQNTGSKVTVLGGHLEMDTYTTVESYTGRRFILHRGQAVVQGADLRYSSAKTAELFTVAVYGDFVFQGNKFEHARSARAYYVDGFGNSFDEAYTRGVYQEQDGQPLATSPSIQVRGQMVAKSLEMRQFNHGVVQNNADATFNLTKTDYPTNLIVSNVYGGVSRTLTINYPDISTVPNGSRMVIVNKVFTDLAGTAVVLAFGTNFRAENVTIPYVSPTDSSYLVTTDLVFTEGAWTQTGRSKIKFV